MRTETLDSSSGLGFHLFDKLVGGAALVVRVYMRSLALLSPRHIGRTFFGAEMECDLRDFIQRRIFFFGVYEPNLTHFLIGKVKQGDICVDLGANVGYFSLLLSPLVGDAGRVIAVEPSPRNFRVLQRNLRRNGIRNVRALNVAVTERPCRVAIIRAGEGNSGKDEARAVRDTEYGDNDGRPLMEILAAEIANVSFIKIDIEGSEGPVLQDILDNLARFPKRFTIAAEIAASSGRFVELFRDAGFKAAAQPNSYDIAYFLVRRYLARGG